MESHIREGLERTAQAEKVRQASPQKSDLLKELPSARLAEEPGGKWTITLKREDFKRHQAMMREANRLKVEQGAERIASVPKERVWNPELGREEALPVTTVEKAARVRGLSANLNGRVIFLGNGSETPEQEQARLAKEAEWDRQREADRLWELEYEQRERV